jgi:hypothetical protein
MQHRKRERVGPGDFNALARWSSEATRFGTYRAQLTALP